jgi:hypothetical protein
MHSRSFILLLLSSYQLLVVSSGLLPRVTTIHGPSGPSTTAAASSSLLVRQANHNTKNTMTRNVRGDSRRVREDSSTPLLSKNSPETEDETELDATAQARDRMRSCARITALSAVVDLLLAVVQEYHAEGGTDDLLASLVSNTQTLTTLWKVIFAWNIGTVVRLYASLEQEGESSSSTSVTSSSLNRVLDTMTLVWRTSAAMITIVAAVDLSKAWQQSHNLSSVLAAVFLGAASFSFYTNAKETKQLQLIEARSGGAADGSSDQEMIQMIAHKGRITIRAMLLCATVLLVKAAVIPFSATRIYLDTASYPSAFLALLSLPTPLGTAGFLRQLRTALLQALSDLVNDETNTMNDNKSSLKVLQPATRIHLAQAQQRFYGRVESTMRGEMIFKTIAAVASTQIVSNIIASLMAGKS